MKGGALRKDPHSLARPQRYCKKAFYLTKILLHIFRLWQKSNSIES